jgi:hypothetical protein
MKLLELIINDQRDIKLLEHTVSPQVIGSNVPEIVYLYNLNPYKLSYVFVHDSSDIKAFRKILLEKTVSKLNALTVSITNKINKVYETELL